MVFFGLGFARLARVIGSFEGDLIRMAALLLLTRVWREHWGAFRRRRRSGCRPFRSVKN